MNRTIIGYCTVVGLGLVFSFPPVATGWWYSRRHRPQYHQQQPTAESVSLEGTVQSITPTHIEVLVDSSTDAPKKKAPKTPHGTWSVLVPHETPIQVSGEATPDYLHHGLMVRFTVEGKEKKQEAAETTHELTIVTAASYKAISKDSSVSLKPAAQKQEAGRAVTGQLGHLHNNQWSVLAEGKTWHIELADDVKINVAFTGSHFAKPGDKISVQGEMIHGKPGTCTANSVQVTLAQPLTASKKQAASDSKNEKKERPAPQ
jgi:hypothetical protein